MARPMGRFPIAQAGGFTLPKEVVSVDVSSADFESAVGFIVEVGTGGALVFEDAAGTEHSWTLSDDEGVTINGQPLVVTKIKSSGTTALNILAGFY